MTTTPAPTTTIQYEYSPGHFHASEPTLYDPAQLAEGELILNMGPQHPSTHGVLRLEIVTDGEIIRDVVPHLGYLHRCFEAHTQQVPFNQGIPFVDRLDYLAAMNGEHIWAMAVEKMLGIDADMKNSPGGRRTEYIRVLVAELNRIASHFVAIGTYGIDIGAFTPFLWVMRDREHIQRMLEWVSGARMLYNYIWIGGVFYDLPVGFEERCREFVTYLKPKLVELQEVLIDNEIFIKRTANVGVLPLPVAIDFGCTGPVLRGSGLRYDLRRVDAYSVYPELDFEIPIGTGAVGTVGDCWDRANVRVQECWQSVRIIEQCLARLTTDLARTRDYDPHEFVPKKIRPKAGDFYFRGESAKGELGFFFRTDGRSDIPVRCHARSCSFHNLSVIADISRGAMLADLVAVIGSLDVVMGEVDR